MRSVTWVLIVLCGCARPPAPLDAELYGCGARFDDGRCALPADGALRVFVPGAAGALELRVDGARVEAVAEVTGEGVRLRLDVPAGATRLQVDDPARRARRVFALAPPEPAVEGDRAALEAALPGASAQRRGLILARLARLHLRAGEGEAAEARFVEAEAAHRAVGRRSAVLRDLEARVFGAVHLQPRYALAARLLARHAALADDRRSRGLGAYSAGLLAWEIGDAVVAAAAFERAHALLRPLGATYDTMAAAEMEAVTLRALGRGDEALRRLAALAAALPADATCDRARVSLNTGWVQLQQRARRGRGVDPRPALEAAHAAFSSPACAHPQARQRAALDLALAALSEGAVDDARRWVATLPSGDDALALWRLDIEGRLALASGDAAGAAATFARLARVAADRSPEAAWRAAVGLGDAREALGDVEGAVEVWRGAEALLDSEALRVPLERDRARFVLDRGRSARRLVGALARLGRPAEALCVARLARNRALARLAAGDRLGRLTAAERQRWKAALARWQQARQAIEADAARDWTLADDALDRRRAARAAQLRAARAALGDALRVVEHAAEPPSCAALRPPAPGEAVLAWFRVEAAEGAAVGFAVTGAGVRSAWIARLDAAALVAPFAAEIEAHPRLRLIVGDGLEALAIDRVEWPIDAPDAAPLGLRRALGWALDLPRRPRGPGSTRALVVADPTGDLPAARQEGAQAAARLRAAGWAVTALTGPAARGDAVRAGATAATLLHYAGHGDGAGDAAMTARLPLAGGGWLDVGDLVTLRRGPRWVVLTGCRTGALDPDAAAGGLTLAHGFLLAGAEAVLASTRTVDDGRAAALGAAVARRLGGPGAVDLVEATRRARAEGGARGDDAFRVWVE